MGTTLSPSCPAAARRDFEMWSKRIQDNDDLAAFARDCADTLARQGVELPKDMTVEVPRRVGVTHRTGKGKAGYRGVVIIRKGPQKQFTCYEAHFAHKAHGARKSMLFRDAVAAAKQYDRWCWAAWHDKSMLNFPELVAEYEQAAHFRGASKE